MRERFVKGLSLAFLVRAPIAAVALLLSVTQYKYFGEEDIVNIAKILSYSSLFSILVLQALGSTYNLSLARLNDDDARRIHFRHSLLMVILILLVAVILSRVQYNLFFALILATSQALFQWFLSFLTVQAKNKALVLLSLLTSACVAILVVAMKNNVQLSLELFYMILIACYGVPGLFSLIYLSYLESKKDNPSKWRDYKSRFLEALSIFPLLSIVYWSFEFLPRLVSGPRQVEYNILMSIIIGFIGAVEVGLGQYFQKSYLLSSQSSVRQFFSFYIGMIKTYVVVYAGVVFCLILCIKILWPLLFSIPIEDNVELFWLLILLQIIRILNFSTFQFIYYHEKLKISIVFVGMIVLSVIMASAFSKNLIGLHSYVITNAILLIVVGILNIQKIKHSCES